MKKIFLSLALFCGIIFGMGLTAFAQEQVPATTTVPSTQVAPAPEKNPMNVKNRLKRQQARINQGIKSGALTRGEAKNLETREANIATDAKIDKAQNGGKLTPQEHKNLEHRLNKQSGRIYRKKNNAVTQG